MLTQHGGAADRVVLSSLQHPEINGASNLAEGGGREKVLFGYDFRLFSTEFQVCLLAQLGVKVKLRSGWMLIGSYRAGFWTIEMGTRVA